MPTNFTDDWKYPKPPLNGQVVTSFEPQVWDIRWDDPKMRPENAAFNVLGVHIYRSDVSDRGPYQRITPYPLGVTYYRDQTEIKLVQQELVRWDTSWVSKGDAPNDRRWVFRTLNPIVKSQQYAPYHRATPANQPTDVEVWIDGELAGVAGVFGPTGEIILEDAGFLDPLTQKVIDPVLPGPESIVTVTYYMVENLVRSGLDTKMYYRITSVATDPIDPTQLVETPLNQCQPFMNIATETIDYIWREAVRRNNWILQQGGERVKVFLRKQYGIPCTHGLDPKTLEYAGQAMNSCQICYGTSWVGGYEGPYEIIIGPEDGERRISQTPTGRKMENTYEVWTGPSPLVTQRDFIVKQTNERYSIGAVRRPSNRGNVLQQHFSLGYLSEGDIRYKVPIVGIAALPWPETRLTHDPDVPYPVVGTTYEPVEAGSRAAFPMETDSLNTPNGIQQRGRTQTWRNINKG